MIQLAEGNPELYRFDLPTYGRTMNIERGKNSQERVRAILSESVSVLCRTMLQYDAELSIRGLLGITLDNREVFLVDILETVHGRNHDVSDVAVIDPGKEDSEGDMLVVDDSDMEGEKGQNRAAHTSQSSVLLDKSGSKCIGSSGVGPTEGGHHHSEHPQVLSREHNTRQTIGLKELGDAAFARSLNHIQQLASKSLLKSSMLMSSTLNRHNGEPAGGVVDSMTSQVLTNTAASQAEPMAPDHQADPNFRLQQTQVPEKQVDNRDQQQQQQHQEQDQQQPMYALCACENTGDANDCALKHANSQTQSVWSHSETGEYVQTPVSMVSQSTTTSTGSSQVHVIPSTAILNNHDPYQMWNKTQNNSGSAQATTSTWQTLPPPPAVSTVPTTWPGPSPPHQQTVSSTKNSSETMVAAAAAAAAAATAPMQSLYSNLPETISSAILHTTYTQGNTPKNLRGEGVFPCKLCSRVFTYKKSKARHMKRHLGEFFTCEVCKKTFCRKDVLARHQHNVHGVKLEVDEKSPSKSDEQGPPTLSMLSQPGEVTVNSPSPYSLTQPGTGGGGHTHQQRTFETVEFSAAAHLTVPRPPLAVVTSIPQPIQSFLTLNHSAISTTHQNTEHQQQTQATLHHGTSPQT